MWFNSANGVRLSSVLVLLTKIIIFKIIFPKKNRKNKTNEKHTPKKLIRYVALAANLNNIELLKLLKLKNKLKLNRIIFLKKKEKN